MNIPTGRIGPVQQAAGSATMFGIILDDLSRPNHMKQVVHGNGLFDHLLLRVLGDPDLFTSGLSADRLQIASSPFIASPQRVVVARPILRDNRDILVFRDTLWRQGSE